MKLYNGGGSWGNWYLWVRWVSVGMVWFKGVRMDLCGNDKLGVKWISSSLKCWGILIKVKGGGFEILLIKLQSDWSFWVEYVKWCGGDEGVGKK